MKIPAFVFARGGSKGLPNKNIAHLGGIPLIGHSILCAQDCPSIDDVYVSTDSEKIKEIALSFGAQVPFMRPDELATDQAPEIFAWRHATSEIQRLYGNPLPAFVSLPATSPLRAVEDVEHAIQVYRDTQPDIVITATDSHRNPYFNMLKIDDQHRAELVINGNFSRRQDAPVVYDMTTVAFVVNTNYIHRANHTLEGDVRCVHVPLERAIDIDSKIDFIIAERMLEERNSHESRLDDV